MIKEPLNESSTGRVAAKIGTITRRARRGVVLLAISTAVSAQLPDFTELVEKQGHAVVNISTVQGSQGNVAGRNFPGIPNMPNIPEDDPFFEFFRRHLPPPGP